MDGGRVHHKGWRGFQGARCRAVATWFAQRGHPPGRAARGRLRHGRGHQEPGHHTETMGLVGERALSDALHLGSDAHHLLRQHHRQGLLRGAGRRDGRPLGHREHTRQERTFHLAGKELRGAYRPHARQNIHQGGAGRILQQPGLRRRGLRDRHLRQGASLVEVQVPGRIRRSCAGRKQRQERQVLQGAFVARQARQQALCHQDFSGAGPERGVHRLVRQDAGIRRRACYGLLLHGEQQAARPVLPAGVQAAGGQSPQRAQDCALHPGRRGEKDRQGHAHRGQPGTTQPGGKPHPQRGGTGQPAHERAGRSVPALRAFPALSGRRPGCRRGRQPHHRRTHAQGGTTGVQDTQGLAESQQTQNVTF